MSKKTIPLAILSILLLFVLTACGNKKENDNYILYKNVSLKFELKLPNSFKYYQTQRVKAGNFVDIDFFVPTSDQSYGKEVPGYAKPFVIRILNNGDNISKDSIYEKLGSGNGKLYTIKFWDKIPQDWQNIWSKKMENKLKDSFKIN